MCATFGPWIEGQVDELGGRIAFLSGGLPKARCD
jgi:hypothetical protein